MQKNLEKSIKEQRRYSKKDIREFSEFFDLTTKAPELQTEAKKRRGPVIITGYQINHEKLDHLLWQYGYIVLVSSCKMTSAEALIAYRKREMIEKSFITPAGFLKMNCFGAGSSQAINGKSLIWFVAVTLQALLFRAISSLREKARDKSLYTISSIIASLDQVEATLDPQMNEYKAMYKLRKELRILLESIGITEEEVYEYPASIEAKELPVDECEEEED